MTLAFGREKRLLLGALAALAPVPLPFNEVLGWPFLLAYLAGMALLLVRARAGSESWLPPWAMNVLGLVYLPLFLIDLRMFSGGRMIGPVLHLGMFAVLIKLFALRRERDKWQALMGIFFLFLAAMATSVHPSVTLYLIAFLAVALLLLLRFAMLHVLAGFGHRDASLARVPLRAFLAACVAFSVVLAVPLFAMLPRVSSPYLSGGVGSGGPEAQTTGFSDEVTLDSIGRIRESREVAMRIDYQREGPPREADVRFKAATFDHYDGRAWRRTPGRRTMLERGAQVQLTEERPDSWADVYLYPVTGKSLPLPISTRVLKLDRRGLEIGTGGAMYLISPATGTLRYSVGLGPRPVSVALPPDPAEASPATLDPTGLTPEMTALAAEVAGAGGARERARRLEAHLARNYTYTLDFVGRGGGAPLEDFLFRYRSGHCEYFASALVLLLRAQGIHARLATGFLGADYNPIERLWVVRQSNAHAWVEAYVPNEGWIELDPTPPAGRPSGGGSSVWNLATQAWDTLVFRWDRYVLTYGLNDQVNLIGALRGLWLRLWERNEDPAAGEAGEPAAEPREAATAAEASAAGGGLLLLAVLLVLSAAALGLWYLRRRGPPTATAAYRRLRHHLARAGVPVAASVPPFALARRAAAARPAAAEPTGRVIGFYVRESFNGEALGEGERGELIEALRRAEAALKKAG
jgi:transglutaminase-like putative cysteine protease